MLLILKAQVKNAHTPDLFAVPVSVAGHVAHGHVVGPYIAIRHKAPPEISHPKAVVVMAHPPATFPAKGPLMFSRVIAERVKYPDMSVGDAIDRLGTSQGWPTPGRMIDTLQSPSFTSSDFHAAVQSWDNADLERATGHGRDWWLDVSEKLSVKADKEPAAPTIITTMPEVDIKAEAQRKAQAKKLRDAADKIIAAVDRVRAADAAIASRPVVVTTTRAAGGGPLGTQYPNEPAHLSEGRKILDRYQQRLAARTARGLDGLGGGANDEKSMALWEARLAADPAKWQPGMGVSYQVSGGAKMQTNRGFRIASIDVAGKRAVLRQVADTGMTSSGGDHDRFEDSYVYLGDLKRDKKHDAPIPIANRAKAVAELTIPDTNSNDATTVLHWLRKIKVGSGDVINDKAVSREGENTYYITGHKSPVNNYRAVDLLLVGAKKYRKMEAHA